MHVIQMCTALAGNSVIRVYWPAVHTMFPQPKILRKSSHFRRPLAREESTKGGNFWPRECDANQGKIDHTVA